MTRREDVARVDAAWATRILAAGDDAAVAAAVAEASYHLPAPSDRGLVWVRRCANRGCPEFRGTWVAARDVQAACSSSSQAGVTAPVT